MLRRFPFKRYVYYGLPPQEEPLFYHFSKRPNETVIESPNGVIVENPPKRNNYVTVVEDVYDYLPFLYAIQPQPNYALDDQIINEITYRILTQITQYKPKRNVEISPVTRMSINLG